MDLARSDLAKAKRKQRILYDSATLLFLAGIALGINRLQPAAPTQPHLTTQFSSSNHDENTEETGRVRGFAH